MCDNISIFINIDVVPSSLWIHLIKRLHRLPARSELDLVVFLISSGQVMQFLVGPLLKLIMHKKVFQRYKRLFPQCFGLKDESRSVGNQRVCTFHASNFVMTQLKSHHAVKVYLVAVQCCERIAAPKKPQNLFLLFLPRQF